MNAFKHYFSCLLFVTLFASAKATPTDSVTVYIFLSETCPICQTATLELKNIYNQYHSKGVEFVGLFPNTEMSNDLSILKFGKKYNLPFPLKVDEGQQKVKQFSALVTPQVFVVSNADGQIIYNGRIDNGFERVGKKRQVTTEFYLKNALDEILSNRPVTMKETLPVGCFINKK